MARTAITMRGICSCGAYVAESAIGCGSSSPRKAKMRSSLAIQGPIAALLSVLVFSPATALAQGVSSQSGSRSEQRPGLTTDLQDPVVQLQVVRQRRAIPSNPNDSLFQSSPLSPLRERLIACEKDLYESTDFKFGASGNHLLQSLTDERAGTDEFGMSSFAILTGTWDGYKKGQACQGEITCSVEGRWNYGPPDPVTLGAKGLGSTLFTANPFTTYTPTFLVRNLFWRQGSREAGWRYRIGRVTPDQFLASSRHITPLDTFLPIGTGAFVIGLPDSGLGWIGGFYLNDNLNIAGVVHDSNAVRSEFGDLGAGDLFKAVELQARLLPLTKNAGFSKVTLWHSDGTADGKPLNGSTGNEGWGVYFKLEQELTCDGRLIAVGRWGRSYKESAAFERLAGAHLVLYDPFNSGRYKRMGFESDVVGVGYDFGRAANALQDESDIELFYRFPLLPEMDMTVAYQAIFNPGQDLDNDFGSAISLRLRSTW